MNYALGIQRTASYLASCDLCLQARAQGRSAISSGHPHCADCHILLGPAHAEPRIAEHCYTHDKLGLLLGIFGVAR